MKSATTYSVGETKLIQSSLPQLQDECVTITDVDVGEIYVMNVSSMPFENIPSISELISTGTVSKSGRNPSDTVFELPTLKGNGHLAHETPAPQLQETL